MKAVLLLKNIKSIHLCYAIIPILVLFAVHFFAELVPEEYNIDIRKMISSAAASVGVFGSVLLLLNNGNIRSKRVFAFILLMVGLAGVFNLISLYIIGSSYRYSHRIASPWVITYGNIYVSLFALYPIEVVRPGWLNVNRFIKLLMPLLTLSIIYISYSYFTDNRYLVVGAYTFVERLLTFDFWLRSLIVFYPVMCIVFVMKFYKEYNLWMEHNTIETEDSNIKWIPYYLIGFIVLLISYFRVLMVDGVAVLNAHGLLFILFFVSFYYKVLFHENPFPEDYFNEREMLNTTSEPVSLDGYTFEDNLEEYKAILDNWIKTEKPYLRKDFKLNDLNEKIHINRSYLSRLINEGYNDTFNNYVTKLRIDESLNLLTIRADLSIARISELSGFSSPSVFGRSFVKIMGLSPKAYRNQIADTECECEEL